MSKEILESSSDIQIELATLGSGMAYQKRAFIGLLGFILVLGGKTGFAGEGDGES